jgi:hypothetical protein
MVWPVSFVLAGAKRSDYQPYMRGTWPNKRAGGDAGRPVCLHTGHQWPGAPHHGRWAYRRFHVNRIAFTLCLGAVLFIGAIASRGEDHKILLCQAEAYHNPGTNQWWVPLSRLERLPLWRGKGNPPLSIEKALRIARRWITPQSGDGDVDHILLRPIGPSAESKYRYLYYYVVEFSVSPYGNYITCVVLMDGTVVEPELRPWHPASPTSGWRQ